MEKLHYFIIEHYNGNIEVKKAKMIAKECFMIEQYCLTTPSIKDYTQILGAEISKEKPSMALKMCNRFLGVD